MADNGGRERTPRNLQGLLRLAVAEQGGPTEGASAAPSSALSSLSQAEIVERRRFLDSVLNSMSTDVVGIMRNSIDILLKPETESTNEEEETNEKIEALDQLMELVDNLDFATDFEKIGGFSILQPCLKSENAAIRHKTAELIAELVQNHPYCQKAAKDCKLLEDLLRLLDFDEDETVRIKCLYAISALLRDNVEAQDEFTERDGFSVVLRAIQSDVEKLKIKSAFLLSALCSQRPSIKDTLCNMGFVEQLIALIQKDHEPAQEHVIAALLSLVTDHQSGIQECQREELNLKNILNEKIKLLTGTDQYLEELEYCNKLMAACFNHSDNENNHFEER
ncbi:hypothetical protein CHUAL_011953 [Chamberlinius hualienensis]